jgi:8-hydroxy-5-deazaflavin:NADPH oxidoreductase
MQTRGAASHATSSMPPERSLEAPLVELRGNRVRVAILGGTGSFGGALAARLVAAGDHEVVIGSRDAARAEAAAAELGGGASGTTNDAAVRDVELAVLAVRADAALDTARDVAGALGQTPLLSVASALSFGKDGVRPDPDARSLAERVQDVVAGPVVAGLHSVAASNIGTHAADEDVLVCGDDIAAKALALELAGTVVAGCALDAGPLANARSLEGLTAVIVNLNKRYKAHAGIRVTGIRA